MPTIFIGNLSFQTTRDQLLELLHEVGAVTSLRMVHDSAGDFRGIAFADFESLEEAYAAIRVLNGRVFLGRELHVSEARPRTRGGKR